MKFNTDIFLEKAHKVHGDEYDYSKVEYKNSNTKVIIICRKHGEFLQAPHKHNDGQGCPLCRIEKMKERFIERNKKPELSIEKRKMVFLEKAHKVHGDKYDYSKVEYKHSTKKVEIVCKKHGSFWQKPDDHTRRKCGCPICKESRGEIIVASLLDAIGISYIREKWFDDCRGETGRVLPFDFFLPDYNTIIEFDGEQHFTPKFNKETFEATLEEYE